MLPPEHDSDAESDLSHVSETSDEAEDGAPVRAQGDTEAESPAPPLGTAAPPLLPLTDPPAGAGVGLPVPLKTLTPPPPLKAPTPPPPHEAHTPLPQPLTAQHAAAACAQEVATAPVGLSAHAAASQIATAFLREPGEAPCSTNTEEVWMHPALSRAADAFCAPQEPESFGESVFEVQSFESITEARREDAQTSADANTKARAPAALEAECRHGYLCMPRPYDACTAEDEKHEHQCAGGPDAPAVLEAQPRHGYVCMPGPHDACSAEDEKHERQCAGVPDASAKEAEQQAPLDKETAISFTQCMAAAPPLACVSGAPAPASASGTSAPRRRRRNELEALRPSAGATHKLLRGAAVTDPRIVGPMPSGCG